ncbi:glycoside hydrolase family 3 N-terminal domain-containing protein [Megasphaera vaginalis (ex Srinivasan et al. 2021)]|uniref:beta-N-acetylhexosaminidase n=1 Tax=Megasphaera vaginalis (ex Srinivasan et al. 2021) TaxID=1111454 RepID=U7UVH6_9FIRM|nr:glycoside hydrolase family 3 N-terminal domain-containing protein [Megasphaera vaginalis (ex Srinivasan et al. 2021)]ERT62473.1 glycoside hydrolase, family 3, N-terminal domain protein [Megasphaera vaginalis (ex Srinivasan et al. 2021)]
MKIFQVKKIVRAVTLSFFVSAALTGCALPFGGSGAGGETRSSVTDTSLTLDQRVDRIVADMPLDEKVGQLFIVGIHGGELNSDSKFILNEFKFGGIILFDRNMQTKAQVTELSRQLQAAAREKQTLPLFLAVDQEGGAVARLQRELVTVPAAADLGRGDVSEAAAYAKRSARELNDIGFNVNFAPDADLGLANGRSFSTSDPQRVSDFAGAVAWAYKGEGLIFSLKHFPGIGRTESDLHVEGNTITADYDTLKATDLKPFEALIPQFAASDFMVMVSHAKYLALDPQYPASLSPRILTDLLRKEERFNGIIITDDLEMGAVANHYSFAEMAVQSFTAGADILLVCHEYAHMEEAYNGMMKAVKSGQISRQRLDASVKRIVRMKLVKLVE